MGKFYDAYDVIRMGNGMDLPTDDHQEKPAIYSNIDEQIFMERVVGHGFNNQQIFQVQACLNKSDDGHEFEQYLSGAGFNDAQVSTVVQCLLFAATPKRGR